jgi:hypothetical protein
MQPEPNLTVTAVTVRTSRLQDGNVLADRVDAYAGPDLGYGITNPCPAEGGVSRVTGRDLDELIEQKLNASPARSTRRIIGRSFSRHPA